MDGLLDILKMGPDHSIMGFVYLGDISDVADTRAHAFTKCIVLFKCNTSLCLVKKKIMPDRTRLLDVLLDRFLVIRDFLRQYFEDLLLLCGIRETAVLINVS